MGTLEQTLTNPIRIDSLSHDYIAEKQQRFNARIFNPQYQQNATEELIALRETWAQDDTITVFTSGVFDMLHLDHSAYLLHTKTAGAAEHYRRNSDKDIEWEERDSEFRELYTDLLLGKNILRLIVSIDGDQSVAIRKGFNPEKGNAPRPVYAWKTRALQVASQAYIAPISAKKDVYLPTVDAVTVHGPHDFESGSTHESHFALVEALQPDVWAFFGESTDIIEQAPTHPALGKVALHCIEDRPGIHYYEDAFIGKMSTTSITKRLIENS